MTTGKPNRLYGGPNKDDSHRLMPQLPNREQFEAFINKQTTVSPEKPFTIFYIKLNHMKTIRYKYGADVSHQLVSHVSGLLFKFLQYDGFLAKMDWHVFAIYLPIVGKKGVLDYTEKLLNLIGQNHLITHYDILLTSNIGTSRFPTDGENSEQLLQHAEVAMQFASEQGRNTFQMYSLQISEKSDRIFYIRNDLHRALVNNELNVVYQPKVHAQSLTITGAEALLRWNHPVWGNISPDEFIPIAEETGLIIPIGEWVLEQVCRQNKAWQEAGYERIPISVNFSIKQIMSKSIYDIVKRILNQSGLDPNYLEIEITESCVADHKALVSNFIRQLNELGVSSALDDFGTGYSAFGFIRDYPIKKVKIDKSFIRHVTKSERHEKVCAGLIHLMHSLETAVVAEGIETREQLHLLQQFNCDELQGYLFNKPLTAGQLEDVIKQGNRSL